MYLEHFILEKYNCNNYFHKSTVILMGNDDEVWKYMGDIDIIIEEIESKSLQNIYDCFYIVYKKGDINPIGIIAFTFFKTANRYSIIYGILPENRGKNLSSVLLTEFTQHLFNKYSEIEEITLQINKGNLISSRTALSSGYYKECGTRYVKKRSIRKDNL